MRKMKTILLLCLCVITSLFGVVMVSSAAAHFGGSRYVLVQLAAVRSALENTGKVILNDHIRHCMVDAVSAGDQGAIDDLCQAIEKFMK